VPKRDVDVVEIVEVVVYLRALLVQTVVVIALAACITHVINLFLRCVQHGELPIDMISTTKLTILHLLLMLSLRHISKILQKLRELLHESFKLSCHGFVLCQ